MILFVTSREPRVPTEVILVCDAVRTVPVRLPVTLPVTSPVRSPVTLPVTSPVTSPVTLPDNAPENVVAVTVPLAELH